MIERKLKELIIERYGSLREFTPHTGLPYTTVHTILKRGIDNSSVENVIAICRALHISADALANGEIIPADTHGKYDLLTVVETLRMNGSADRVSLDGQPLSDAEFKMLVDGIAFSAELIRTSRKDKK